MDYQNDLRCLRVDISDHLMDRGARGCFASGYDGWRSFASRVMAPLGLREAIEKLFLPNCPIQLEDRRYCWYTPDGGALALTNAAIVFGAAWAGAVRPGGTGADARPPPNNSSVEVPRIFEGAMNEEMSRLTFRT